MAERGRPTSLTESVQAAIIDGISAGLYRIEAAIGAGICERSFHKWCERGRGGEEPYATFYAALQKAEADVERKALASVVNGAKNWQGCAWFLERKYPGRWGGRVKAAVQEQIDAVIAQLKQGVSDEDFDKITDALRAATAEQALTAH